MRRKKYGFYVWMALLLSITIWIWATPKNLTTQEEPQIKTWKLPIYMQENLQWMLNDFNKRFQEKVDSYEKELRIRFEEFRDMPEDVVLDIEAGIFIKRSDFVKLQDQLRRKTAEEQIKKGGKEK